MSLPSDYEKRSAREKGDLLWANVNADPYPDAKLPTRAPSPIARLKLFSVDFNKGSFVPGDELPPDRPKLVHTYGTCARMSLRITEKHPYTGMLEQGGDALVRFSDAKGGSAFLPSLAFKFFVDGRSSTNVLVLPSAYRDKGDLRCFSSAYCNATPPAKELDSKLVQHSFQKTAKAMGASRLYAVYLPLHDFASIRADGTKSENPVVPDRLEFVPTDGAKAACPDLPDFRRALAAIPVGTILFRVFAAPNIDKPSEPIGEVRLDSPWVASAYGDTRLFFQHDAGPMGQHPH
ncbi:MAG: hypothetical protein IPM54_28795 [Polyangiaceae bacterium]|nr:hypothetical protein [Polyangiaceae bacterium]